MVHRLAQKNMVYFWVVGQSCLENFYSTNLELASQSTPILVCLALYLLYINDYIEIGTIYDSETFTHTVVQAFTVWHGILKSHYLQRNPLFPCHATSLADQNETWALEDCRNDQGSVLNPKLVCAAGWYRLLLLTVLQISMVALSSCAETDVFRLCHQAKSRNLCRQEGMNDEHNWFWTGMKVQLLKVQKEIKLRMIRLDCSSNKQSFTEYLINGCLVFSTDFY